MGSYATVPLDDLVQAALGASVADPMVFFLGAGASRPSPACLPDPPTIQRAVLGQVAPAGASTTQLAGSLPEIYHEILAHLGGPGALEIWRCLTFWESPTDAPQLAALDLGPNLVHMLTVYLAWRCRTPVVTVNFDQMLERAAERLGLTPRVELGAPTDGRSVAIWKLHGSVADIGSIRTTLQSITASFPRELRAIEREFRRARGCLIGYSGRDIDFFPFLCQWRAVQPIYWLNLDFTDTAIERFSGPFRAIEGVGAEVWARETIDRLPAVDSYAKMLKAELGRPLPKASVAHAAYADAIESWASQLLGPMFAGQDGRRLLVQALALAAIGRNREAWSVLDRFSAVPRPAALECRAELLRAALAHERSRYLDSRAHARRAKLIARRERLRPQAVEAAIAIDESRRMASTARFVQVQGRRSIRAALESGWALLAMWWHAVRFLPGQIPWRREASSRPDFDRLRASFAYIEHLVRLGAFAQGLGERLLPGVVVTAVSRPYWRVLMWWSERRGYAFGIGNAKKFALRRTAADKRDEEVLSAHAVYELLSSPTGLAIDRRDRAEAAGKRIAGLPAGAGRGRLKAERVALLKEALFWAREADNASLVLKAMEGMKIAEPSYSPSRAEVMALLDQVQGPAYEEIRGRLLAFLTR